MTLSAYMDPMALNMGVLYLLSAQTIYLVSITVDGDRDVSWRRAAMLNAALLVGFYMAWGGYSIDAWRYLWRFEKNPLSLDPDRLFWIAGFVLSEIVDDPWPVKLYSTLAVAIFLGAIVWHYRKSSGRVTAAAVFVVPLLPVFFFGFGNAIRQGLAGAILILALVGFEKGRKRLAVFSAIAAALIHLPVLVIGAAAMLARFTTKWALFAAPGLVVLGFLIPVALGSVGIEMDALVQYATRSEGEFHYAKFVVYALLAALLLAIIVVRSERSASFFEALFLYSFGLSCLLVKFEVPFERFLLYVDMSVPFIVATLLPIDRLPRWGIAALCIGGCLIGMVFWSHRSVELTLGFAA